MDPRGQVSSAHVCNLLERSNSAWTRVRVRAAGKTELLYHVLCRCVMPAAAGGLEVEVMFVDTDYSLDMLRLVSILDRRLSAGTHAHTHAHRVIKPSFYQGVNLHQSLLKVVLLTSADTRVEVPCRAPAAGFTSPLCSLSSQLPPLPAPPLKPCYAPAFLASWWCTAPPPLSSSSLSSSWRPPCHRGRAWRSSSSTASLLSIGWTAARAEPAWPSRRRSSAGVRSCWAVCSGTGAQELQAASGRTVVVRGPTQVSSSAGACCPHVVHSIDPVGPCEGRARTV